MRLIIRTFFPLAVAMTSCVSVTQLNQSLEKPHIDIGIEKDLTKPFAGISIPAGININGVLPPAGLPPQSFCYKTGVIVLPLLFYNQFQSNFMVTLGARQFIKPIDESFNERFSKLMSSCQDSARVLKEPYSLSLDLKTCQVQGIFVEGAWSFFYGYGSMSGQINYGRNASSQVRIRWELSKGDETMLTGDIKVLLKDPYLGAVAGFLENHGRRSELNKKNLNFEIPFQIDFEPDAFLNQRHILQMVQTLCLGLDKASEEILKEVQTYFDTQSIGSR